jgi:hypothetical protein
MQSRGYKLTFLRSKLDIFNGNFQLFRGSQDAALLGQIDMWVDSMVQDGAWEACDPPDSHPDALSSIVPMKAIKQRLPASHKLLPDPV